MLAMAGVAGALTGGWLPSTSSPGLTAPVDVRDLGGDASNLSPGNEGSFYADVSVSSTGALAFWATGSPANALVDGSVRGQGVELSVSRCSVAWVWRGGGSGRCPGDGEILLAPGLVSTMSSGSEAVTLPGTLDAGEVAHLRIAVTLVADETSVNGVPSPGGLEGLTTTLTYDFGRVPFSRVSAQRSR